MDGKRIWDKDADWPTNAWKFVSKWEMIQGKNKDMPHHTTQPD